MADLALALTKSAAASPIAAMLAGTSAPSAKGGAQTGATDPFAILMAAAAPATPPTLAAVPPVEEPGPAAVREKAGDGETAKEDGDEASDPDALLALLTAPAPIAQQIVPPTVATAPVAPPVDTPDAPVAKAVVPVLTPTVLARTPAAATDPVSVAPTMQTSIQALVKMMTAQADPATAPQPVAVSATTQAALQPIATQAAPQPTAAPAIAPAPLQPVAAPVIAPVIAQVASQPVAAPAIAPAALQPVAAPAIAQVASQPLAEPAIAQTASPPIVAPVLAQAAAPTSDEAMLATAAQAVPTLTSAEAKPLTRANARFLAPKLEGARSSAKSGTTTARPEIRKADTAEAKPQRRDIGERPATDTAAAQPQQQDTKPAAREAAAVGTKALDIGSNDAVVTRHLAVAKDGQWLDGLAKDIAATGGNTGSLSFTLSPANLGGLKVDITQGSDGASVHMTTDTDAARTIILDAQPRLAAEARAQGLTIKESSVSTNSDSQRQAPTQQQAHNQAFGQSSGQQPGQDRRAFAQTAQQPLAPILSPPADKESDGELYA